MRAPILTALALTLAAVAAGTAGDAKKDQDQLQGTWTVVLLEEKGKKAPEEITKELSAEIKGDKLAILEKGKVMEELRFKLDPTKKPSEVDFTYLTGEDKGKTELGIYEIAGDTVKFCINDSGKPRPKTFSTSKEDELNVVVIKRKK